MRVVDEILKGVVFIGTEAGGLYVPYGTALMAGYPYRGNDFMILLTAAHVVDQIPPGDISVRYNRVDGQAAAFKIARDRVQRDPISSHDLAALPFDFPGGPADVRYVKLSRENARKDDEIWEVGLGDEVFAVGLYTSHYGETRNIPVIRTGNISAMPGEPVLASGGSGYTQAYLAEIRSLGGLSGAPLFCNVPTIVSTKNHGIRSLDGPRYNFLGIMLGHHVVSTKEDQILSGDEKPVLTDRNTGLSVVLPRDAILSFLEGPEMVANLDLSIEELKGRPDLVSDAKK